MVGSKPAEGVHPVRTGLGDPVGELATAVRVRGRRLRRHRVGDLGSRWLAADPHRFVPISDSEPGDLAVQTVVRKGTDLDILVLERAFEGSYDRARDRSARHDDDPIVAGAAAGVVVQEKNLVIWKVGQDQGTGLVVVAMGVVLEVEALRPADAERADQILRAVISFVEIDDGTYGRSRNLRRRDLTVETVVPVIRHPHVVVFERLLERVDVLARDTSLDQNLHPVIVLEPAIRIVVETEHFPRIHVVKQQRPGLVIVASPGVFQAQETAEISEAKRLVVSDRDGTYDVLRASVPFIQLEVAAHRRLPIR